MAKAAFPFRFKPKLGKPKRIRKRYFSTFLGVGGTIENGETANLGDQAGDF